MPQNLTAFEDSWGELSTCWPNSKVSLAEGNFHEADPSHCSFVDGACRNLSHLVRFSTGAPIFARRQ
jgi:hypothetical protein